MKILFKLILFFWVLVIFYLSSQSGEVSVQVSGRVTEVVTGSLALHDFIRVLAHFGEYFILSILFYVNFKLCDIKVEYSLMVVFFVSFMDEILQSQVPGRVMDIVDLLIDNAGSIVGFMIISLVYKVIEKQ